MTLKERVNEAVDAYMVYYRFFINDYKAIRRQTPSQYITEAQTKYSGEYQHRIIAVVNKMIHRRITTSSRGN